MHGVIQELYSNTFKEHFIHVYPHTISVSINSCTLLFVIAALIKTKNCSKHYMYCINYMYLEGTYDVFWCVHLALVLVASNWTHSSPVTMLYKVACAFLLL